MSSGLEVGQQAPNFSWWNSTGKKSQLEDFRGQYVVIFFYPKAFTPGCTKETIRFRDNYDDLRALGAEVVGVSVDDDSTQCKFSDTHQVQFPLVADFGKRISRSFEVMRGILPFAKRITFIVDHQGIVVARFHHEFQVSKHLDSVVQFLRQQSVAE